MKKSFIIIALAITASVNAQNLIKNPEFQGSINATYRSQIKKAEGWSDANGGSVDLFSKSTCKTDVGIPENFMGKQDSDGSYAGLTVYYEDMVLNLPQTVKNLEITDKVGYGKYSEYLQGEISQSLIPGQIYVFSLDINLADKSGRAVKDMGVYFSSEKIEHKNNRALSYVPQIIFDEYVTDKDNWTTVTGTFVAKGDEKYFTFGAFEGTFTAKSIVTPKKENDNKRAYYYVNGLSLEKFPLSKDDLEVLRRATEMVFFNTGSAEIKKESYDELDKIASILSKHTQIEALVEGHTDNTGSDELNMRLSKDRAKAVKDYLVSKGIDANRLKSEGYGPTRPIANNDTDEGRTKNRRVVVKTSIYKVKK